MSGIYDYIARRFPYYGSMDNPKGWQNSIRHNLSLNKAFVRHKERDDGGRKGGTWSINPSVSIGSFKRVKVSALDDSFWEPDESVFGPSAQSDIPTFEKQVTNSSSDRNEHYVVSCENNCTMSDSEFSDTSDWGDQSSVNGDRNIEKNRDGVHKTSLTGLDEFRRKSVEDFLEMDNAILESSPRGAKHCKRVSRHKRNERKQRQTIRLPNHGEICSELLVPLPPLSVSTFPVRSSSSSIPNLSKEVQNDANKTLLDLDLQYRKLPFEGSMDYWEQYDPEFARSRGVAVITSNEDDFPDCVEALCFLCGSEGEYRGLSQLSCGQTPYTGIISS